MRPETTDTLLEELGGCGLFQVMVTSICALMEMSIGWSMVMMVFGGYNPGMTCLTSDFNQALEDNSSSSNNSSSSSNNTNNNNNKMSSQEHSDGFEVSTGNVSLLSFNMSTHWWSTTCAEMQTCPGEIRFKDSASTVVTEWGLVCDRAWIISLIISVQMLGVLLGSLFSGQLATRYGRKTILYGGLGGSVVFSVVSALSVSWPMFVVLRFLSGLTMGTIFTVSEAFNGEFLTQCGRGVVSVLPSWPFSNITFGLVIMGLKDWRHLQYVTAGFSGAVFLTVVWVPESMRWLAVHGKISRAKQIPEKIARLNRKPVPDLGVLETLSTLKDDKEIAANIWFPYVNLFRKKILKRTFVLSIECFSMATVYYAITFGVSALSGNFYSNYILLVAAALPVQFCTQFLVTRVGRRLLSSCLMAITAITSVAVVIVQIVMDKENNGLPTSILAILSFGCLCSAWPVIKLWTMELYPTTFRTIALGWVESMARLGGIVAPYLIPMTILPLYACYIILSFLMIVSFSLLLTLPETKGQALPDVKIQSLGNRVTTVQHKAETAVNLPPLEMAGIVIAESSC